MRKRDERVQRRGYRSDSVRRILTMRPWSISKSGAGDGPAGNSGNQEHSFSLQSSMCGISEKMNIDRQFLRHGLRIDRVK